MPNTAPELRFALSLEATIGEAVEFGEVGGGRRRMVPITGGRFSGRLEGRILAGGADWQTIRPSGVTDAWARYTLQTTAGDHILATNIGVRRASAEVSARIAAGETVDPTEYYFRTAPVFETGAPEHRWLMEATFVCRAERWPDKVLLTVFEVL